MTYYEEWGRNMTDFCEQSGFGFLASPSDRYLEFRFLQAPPLARLNPSEHPDQLRLSWSATNFVLSCDLLPLQRFQFRVSALQHKVWCWMELKVCFLCNLYQYHVTFFQQGFFFSFFLLFESEYDLIFSLACLSFLFIVLLQYLFIVLLQYLS